MKLRLRVLAMLALLATVSIGHAAPTATAEKEIRHLLSFVAQSGCTFVRNGTDYPAAKASEHLASKYDQTRDKLSTADDFIRYVASTSSMTGKPYLARCNGKSETTSGAWLTTELARFRKQGK